MWRLDGRIAYGLAVGCAIMLLCSRCAQAQTPTPTTGRGQADELPSTRTPTAAATATLTLTPTITRTPASTATATPASTATRTSTRTPTAAATATAGTSTATPTIGLGQLDQVQTSGVRDEPVTTHRLQKACTTFVAIAVGAKTEVCVGWMYSAEAWALGAAADDYRVWCEVDAGITPRTVPVVVDQITSRSTTATCATLHNRNMSAAQAGELCCTSYRWGNSE